MGEPLGSYNPKVVQKFYESYAASIVLMTSTGMSDQDQPLLAHTLVRGVRVDLLEKRIHSLLF